MGLTNQLPSSRLAQAGVIPNTAARPASPYEGQMVYQQDIDKMLFWDGTAWRFMGDSTTQAESNLNTVVANPASRPASPYEGQMVYEASTDMIAVWNGSAWRYIASTTASTGGVLQVVQGTFSTQNLFSGTSFADTGASLSITPKSTSSKILVWGVCNWYSASTNYFVTFNLSRNGSSIVTSNNQHTDNAANTSRSTALMFLDSPSSTSALTYTMRINAQGFALYAQHNGAPTVIVAMEVAG